MKNFSTLFLFLFSIVISAQNYELSTLRIGEYKIFMKKEAAEKLANKTFEKFDNYDPKNSVNYFGEKIELVGYETYLSETEQNVVTVQHLSTKSKKFRTKSGMGVGSTKDELLNAYKNYPNYSVNQSWEENESKTTSFFRLTDIDARTELSFKLVNNTVVEVTIYVNEGC